jgi:FAD:protein FMN transferase
VVKAVLRGFLKGLGLSVTLGVVLAPVPALAQWLQDRQAIMGTDVSVSLWHEDLATGRAAIAAVMADMRQVDAQFSPYIPDSELARLNARAAQSPQVLSEAMALLIETSLHYSALSEGAFDITFASLGWHYDYRQGKQPTDAQRQSLLPAINYRGLVYNRQQRTLAYGHPNVRIDLGGIAKGYAVDRAIALLQARGIAHATVSAGGDSRMLGDKRGQPWMVGIKNPRPQSAKDAVITLMPLSDSAISTSGDYERYFLDPVSGERIHHIINPKTGKSARGVMSVTILGPKGIDTDALSTSVFVLGVEKGLALIARLPGFDAVIIDQQGRVHYSPGLAPPEA